MYFDVKSKVMIQLLPFSKFSFKGRRKLCGEDTFCALTVVVVSSVYTSVKAHRIVNLKWVQFIILKLDLCKTDIEKIQLFLISPIG